MSQYLRVWLVLGLFVSVGMLTACARTDAPGPEDGATITMNYQEDAFPRERIVEGRRAVAPFLGEEFMGDGFISKTSMQELDIILELPPLAVDTYQLEDKHIERMSVTLAGPAASGVVEIEQEFGVSTDLERDAMNGETVIHGVIYGTLIYPDDSRAEITISGAAIVERQQGRFNVIIDEHDGIPGLAFQVGDLEWTEELDRVVYPERYELTPTPAPRRE
jgi:hypothetical protein